MENVLYTEQQLSEVFGVSRQHITTLRKSGAIGHVRLGKSRLIRFTQQNVSDFLAVLAQEPQSRGVRSLRKLAEGK
jgi:excisionase family DNA binding protein